MIARPFRKKIAFIAVRLDRLDHHQTVDRRAVLFALILLNFHVHVRQLPTKYEEDEQIDQTERHAD